MRNCAYCEGSIQDEYGIVLDVADKLGEPEHPEYGYNALKSVLHVIRDLLYLEEVILLSSILPTYLRGVFFEEYTPQDAPVMIYNREFLNQFRLRMGPRNYDYLVRFLNEKKREPIRKVTLLEKIEERLEPRGAVNPEDAFWAVMDVIHSRVSRPEMDVIGQLIEGEPAGLYETVNRGNEQLVQK